MYLNVTFQPENPVPPASNETTAPAPSQSQQQIPTSQAPPQPMHPSIGMPPPQQQPMGMPYNYPYPQVSLLYLFPQKEVFSKECRRHTATRASMIFSKEAQ